MPKPLNADQEKAFEAVVDFMLDPNKKAMVITGGPGTGKTFLIEHICKKFYDLVKLQKDFGVRNVNTLHVTATTQQAVSVLGAATGHPAQTIQSLLNLRVMTDYSQRCPVTKLVSTNRTHSINDALVIIDEMSYESRALKAFVKTLLKNSKVIHVGDYDQILAVGDIVPSIRVENYPTVKLSIIERRQDINGVKHPITGLSENLIEVINSGKWKPFKADGEHLYVCKTEDEFSHMLQTEFSRSNWKFQDSCIACYKNETVKNYNSLVKLWRSPTLFEKGDMAISNKKTNVGRSSIPNNAKVQVLDIEHETKKFGPYAVRGINVTTVYGYVFMPLYEQEVKVVLNYAHNTNNIDLKREIDERWADFRHGFAMTADKLQGSTYNTIFVDLNDFSKITSKNAMVRRLNVAVTRARHKVIFYGDLKI